MRRTAAANRRHCDSTAGGVLVKTIVELARAFGMTTVAEGVEKQVSAG